MPVLTCVGTGIGLLLNRCDYHQYFYNDYRHLLEASILILQFHEAFKWCNGNALVLSSSEFEYTSV